MKNELVGHLQCYLNALHNVWAYGPEGPMAHHPNAARAFARGQEGVVRHAQWVRALT